MRRFLAVAVLMVMVSTGFSSCASSTNDSKRLPIFEWTRAICEDVTVNRTASEVYEYLDDVPYTYEPEKLSELVATAMRALIDRLSKVGPPDIPGGELYDRFMIENFEHELGLRTDYPDLWYGRWNKDPAAKTAELEIERVMKLEPACKDVSKWLTWL